MEYLSFLLFYISNPIIAFEKFLGELLEVDNELYKELEATFAQLLADNGIL